MPDKCCKPKHKHIAHCLSGSLCQPLEDVIMKTTVKETDFAVLLTFFLYLTELRYIAVVTFFQEV